MMRNEPTVACFLLECDLCNSSKMTYFVAEQVDKANIETIKFSFWVTTPRCDLTSQEMDTDNFLDSFCRQLQKEIVHEFIENRQFQFIKYKKASLIPKTTVIRQMNFAEVLMRNFKS